MVDRKEKITLAPVTWCAQVEAFLSTVKTEVPLETARQQIASGMKLIGVFADGALSGVFMVDIEQQGESRVLWLLWGAGKAAGIDLTKTVLPLVETFAKKLGCAKIFFMTRRAGLVAKAEKLGYGYYETVMMKAVA